MSGSFTHVVLLRGINVGGKNVIPMKELAATFTGLGFDPVQTYIASGNVLLGAKEGDPRKLEARIEPALEKRHHYDARVVVRTREQMARLAKDVPREWSRPSSAWRYNVLFLRHTVDHPGILDELEVEPGVERVWYRPGVLFWSAQVTTISRSVMGKLSGRPLYQELTVRNFNTTQKLCELIAG